MKRIIFLSIITLCATSCVKNGYMVKLPFDREQVFFGPEGGEDEVFAEMLFGLNGGIWDRRGNDIEDYSNPKNYCWYHLRDYASTTWLEATRFQEQESRYGMKITVSENDTAEERMCRIQVGCGPYTNSIKVRQAPGPVKKSE